MKIGDVVRAIKGAEEGKVVGFLEGNQVEVEIEDGFVLPYNRSDLAVVAKEEAAIFKRSPAEAAALKNPKKGGKVTEKAYVMPKLKSKGIFLAFEPVNDHVYDLMLLNQTDYQLLFAYFREKHGATEGVASQEVAAQQFVKLGQLSTGDFDNWGSFLFQVLLFRKGPFPLVQPLQKKIRFSVKSFFKHKKQVSVPVNASHVYQLDELSDGLDPEKLRERLLDGEPTEDPMAKQTPRFQVPSAKPTKPLKVDLHLDALLPAGQQIPKNKALEYQLKVFEDQLDRAITQGYDEVIFIHGVGNGTLRTEIQRRLGQHVHVDYFKDAQREKFGTGATLAKIK